MKIARQLKAAQCNAERQIRALDEEADRLEPDQVLRWVDRVLEDRSQHIDRIGRRFRATTMGNLTITFATPPQEVKALSLRLAEGLNGGKDVSQLKERLISSFTFADDAGRISFASNIPGGIADAGQRFETCRREMAECRAFFKSRQMPIHLLFERCRMLYKKGRELLDGFESQEPQFADELESFRRFREMVERVAAA